MPRGVYIRTEKIKQKMSKAKKGENNPMYGKSLYSVWLTLYGKEEADNLYKKWKNYWFWRCLR